jgi:acetylornithine deacetylase/succinyl-diaminopimelate desuccinylase-like protein
MSSLMEKIQWEKAQDETVDLFRQYLQIDTTNPPGNEIAAARFFKEILDREGIESRVFEPEPGRGSIMATLRGSGEKKPVIMMNHMDVVPHEPEKWCCNPFEAAEKDGYIYARGAQDMKSLGMLEFMALLLLKRSGARLSRDVIFLGCADEERGGSMGIGWLIDNVPALAGAGLCVNEGGGITETSTGSLIYKVGFTEKIPSWFRVIARGDTGHGSVPHVRHCNRALVKAMNVLVDWKPEIDLVPIIEKYLSTIGPFEDAKAGPILTDIRNSIKDPEKMRILEEEYPQFNALLRDTLTLNIIHSGSKINVIPSEGYAEFDTRILPGHTRDGLLAKVRELLQGIPVEVEMKGGTRPVSEKLIESEDSEFYRAVEQLAREMSPGAAVTPYVMAGASDSQYTRSLGIPSYGFAPLILNNEEKKRVHGHDERMSVRNMKFGVRGMFRLMEMVAASS